MVLGKTLLSSADLEAQTALELPDRHTLWCDGGPTYTVNILSGNNFFSFNNLDYDNAINICAAFLNFNAGIQTTQTPIVECTIVQDVTIVPPVPVLPTPW